MMQGQIDVRQHGGNSTAPEDDHTERDVRAPWQEAISARLDGEDPGIDERLVNAHLARCPACRSFQARAEKSRRRVRVMPAGSMPDLSRRIVKLNAIADRAGRWSMVRAVLGVVAIQIIAFSLPALVLGDEQSTSAHAARHLGAFTAAYGVGLLVVVARPAASTRMFRCRRPRHGPAHHRHRRSRQRRHPAGR